MARGRVHLRSHSNPAGYGGNLRLIMERKLVDPGFAGWNRIAGWLKLIDRVRKPHDQAVATSLEKLCRSLTNSLVEAAIRDAIGVHLHRDPDAFRHSHARNGDDVVPVETEQEEVSPGADDANPLPWLQRSHI
jgi:hypothetical protein